MRYLEKCLALEGIAFGRLYAYSLMCIEAMFVHREDWGNNKSPPGDLKGVFYSAKKELRHD
jgi:hypothetical protein